ncbi:MAG TPA: hypothetical protein VK821_19445 [Dehalococcoidia bacterium]|nr:hypothetical protein [Dehalococcoidia bacterium]
MKDKLRQLVELIDDDEDSLEEAIDYLRWLASDEPEELTPEEWESVRKGEAQIARGEWVSWKDLKRELGL